MGRSSAIGVALLLVLAGCSGVIGSDDGGARTVAPALRETPSPTPEYPPGVSADGVDSGSLAAAHDAVLGNVSLTVYRNETLVAANGTTLATWRTVTRTEGSRLRYNYVATGDRPGNAYRLGDTFSFWTDGTETVVRRVLTDGTVRYSSHQGVPRTFAGVDDSGEGSVNRAFSDWPLAPAGTAVQEGESLTVLRSTGSPRWVAGTTDVRNASLVAYVTDEGVVRSYTARYEVEFDGVTATRTVTFRVTDLSETTVTRPSWYDEAANATQRVTGNAIESA